MKTIEGLGMKDSEPSLARDIRAHGFYRKKRQLISSLFAAGLGVTKLILGQANDRRVAKISDKYDRLNENMAR